MTDTDDLIGRLQTLSEYEGFPKGHYAPKLFADAAAELDRLQQALSRAEADRDAAQATIAAVRDVLYDGRHAQVARRALAILSQASTDALTRHDAEVKAPGVEEARDTLKGWYANGAVDPIGALGYIAKAIREEGGRA